MPLLKPPAVMLPLLVVVSLLLLLLFIILMLLLMKGLLALKVVEAALLLKTVVEVSGVTAAKTSEKSVSRCTPASPFSEKWVTLTGSPAAGTAVRGGGRWWGMSSAWSRSTSRWEEEAGLLLLLPSPRLRVSLSPP